MKRNIAQDESGAVAMIFGLAVIPIVFLAGAAIDYSVASSNRSSLQAALDRAALVGAKAAGSETTTAKAAFDQEATSSQLNGAESNWNFDKPTGRLTGSATATSPTSFTAILRDKPVTVAASVTAQQKGLSTPTQITISLNIARGWYWKKLTVFKKEKDDSTPVALGVLTYQPTTQNNGGTGTLKDQNGNTLTAGASGLTFAVGTNYSALYLQMDVITDGCAPGMIPKSGSNFSCIEGKKSSSTQTYSFKTDDPLSAGQLFTSATQVATTLINSTISSGKSTQTLFTQLGTAGASNVSSIFQCGKTTTQAWEDTKPTTAAFNSGSSWWTQDIYFDINVPTCALNTNFEKETRILK